MEKKLRKHVYQQSFYMLGFSAVSHIPTAKTRWWTPFSTPAFCSHY